MTKQKKGKSRNRYDWNWIKKKSKKMSDFFDEKFPEYTEKSFNRFVAHEPCFQFRTGTYPSWVQGAEYQKCQICKKTMSLVVQLPFEHIDPKSGAMLYIFGCPTHPEKLSTLQQFT